MRELGLVVVCIKWFMSTIHKKDKKSFLKSRYSTEKEPPIEIGTEFGADLNQTSKMRSLAKWRKNNTKRFMSPIKKKIVLGVTTQME